MNPSKKKDRALPVADDHRLFQQVKTLFQGEQAGNFLTLQNDHLDFPISVPQTRLFNPFFSVTSFLPAPAGAALQKKRGRLPLRGDLSFQGFVWGPNGKSTDFCKAIGPPCVQ